MSDYGFGQENIFELINDDVTLAKIEQAFSKLIEVGTNPDNLIICYSGHGYYDKKIKQGFWVSIKKHTTDLNIYNSEYRHYYLSKFASGVCRQSRSFEIALEAYFG